MISWRRFIATLLKRVVYDYRTFFQHRYLYSAIQEEAFFGGTRLCLIAHNFSRTLLFLKSLKLLEEDMRKQEWGIRGPANKQFYLQCGNYGIHVYCFLWMRVCFVLNYSKQSSDQPAQSVKQLADFFESPVFMKYLAKITGCVVKRSRRLVVTCCL